MMPQQEASVSGPSAFERPPFERRRSKRYAIGFPLRFTLHGPTVDFSGTGTAINMSSTGLLFRSESTIPAGDAIAAVMDWPQAAGGAQLLLQGRVIWCKAPLVAVRFSRHAFVPQAGAAEPLPVGISLQLRHTTHSVRRSLSPVLVVESIETYMLATRMMSRHGTRRVSVKAAVRILEARKQPVGLLITNTLREFAPLNLSIPVIYVSRGENDQQVDLVGMFPTIVILRKPVVYRALLAAVQQLRRVA